MRRVCPVQRFMIDEEAEPLWHQLPKEMQERVRKESEYVNLILYPRIGDIEYKLTCFEKKVKIGRAD